MEAFSASIRLQLEAFSTAAGLLPQDKRNVIQTFTADAIHALFI